MTHCHISTQCDRHAEDEERKRALEDEIERVADDLMWKLPSWVITDETYILARNEAERVVKLKMRGIE